MNRFFDLSDSRTAVWAVQEMLDTLSHGDPAIPRVPKDGCPGAALSAAVSAFQNEHALPATGEVDPDTFLALAQAYEETRSHETSEAIHPFARQLKDGMVSPGDAFDLVTLIQIMLSAVGEVLDDVIMENCDGVYGDETRHAVEAFQRVSGLPVNGCVDLVTWNRLARLYDSVLSRG